jgi:hypothetical protein
VIKEMKAIYGEQEMQGDRGSQGIWTRGEKEI